LGRSDSHAVAIETSPDALFEIQTELIGKVDDIAEQLRDPPLEGLVWHVVMPSAVQVAALRHDRCKERPRHQRVLQTRLPTYDAKRDDQRPERERRRTSIDVELTGLSRHRDPSEQSWWWQVNRRRGHHRRSARTLREMADEMGHIGVDDVDWMLGIDYVQPPVSPKVVSEQFDRLLGASFCHHLWAIVLPRHRTARAVLAVAGEPVGARDSATACANAPISDAGRTQSRAALKEDREIDASARQMALSEIEFIDALRKTVERY
jgi:hypothetical protein